MSNDSENKIPPQPANPTSETETAADPGRREWLKAAGKKAYIAPTLVAITLSPSASGQFPPPPSPP